MPYTPREEFKKLVDEIKSSGTPHKLTVRRLLSLFYQERRSRRISTWIKTNLLKSGIECIPDLDSVYIDGEIALHKKAAAKANKHQKESESAPQAESASERDLIPRLALLPSANRKPITVNRDADLKRASTLMLLHDYSQLPVTQNFRDVDGMISWKSIVTAQASGGGCSVVRECMTHAIEILPHDATLFDAVRTVLEKEVVLVKGPDKSIVGLVTIADIGQQFVELAEPFLILEQIESHLRTLLDGKFTVEQLKDAIDPSDDEREIEAISDLSFGEYIRLLEKPDHWTTIGLDMDRATFVKRLDEIRRIRNDVMHFHPDGISDSDKETLRETVRFFYAISQFKKSS